MNRSLFPPTVITLNGVFESYHCRRIFRRTSDTRSLEEKVSGTDIDLVNKWDQVGSQRKVLGQSMKEHYAQFDILLKPFFTYTQSM